MLDIGEGTGALVVYTSEAGSGREIEIRPHDGAWAGVHTAVRPRLMGATVLHAGVFGSLPAGLYDLRVRPADGAAVQTVRVVPGAVAETSMVGVVEGP
jgi:hypothetical protein